MSVSRAQGHPVPVTFLLDKVARSAAQRFASRLIDLEIRPAHLGLLTAVATLGRPSQAQVSTWLGVGPSVIVGLVDDMQSRGAVTRSADPASRRRWTLSLTAAGRELQAEATSRALLVDDELLASVSAEQRGALRDLLIEVTRGLGIAATPTE